MSTMYRMPVEEYYGLWQPRGVRAAVLERSVVRGDYWTDLDRVTRTEAGLYMGHVGKNSFALGAFGPELYTEINAFQLDVADTALTTRLNWSMYEVQEWLAYRLEDSDGDSIYNVTIRDGEVGDLLATLQDKIEKETDVKSRMASILLSTVVHLTNNNFVEAIKAIDIINENATALSEAVAKRKGRA